MAKNGNSNEPENHALVLQGGGALGAYQAGVYEALHEGGLSPGWVAGISIGAINAGIIAGNAPPNRIPRLREFWNGISSQLLARPVLDGEQPREWFNEASSAFAAAFGLPGFFTPRFPPAVFAAPGAAAAISIYDTTPLEKTLNRLIDFDVLNNSQVRLSVGAVNIRTGNFCYFDTAKERLGPRHIMASGALPPGFPPIEIDGEYYWDGGIVSNTPLQYVLDQPAERDMLVFQIDLFSARGPMPRTLSEVAEREKDIRFSSRTRLNTDMMQFQQNAANAARRLAAKLPPKFADDPDLKALAAIGPGGAVTIVHFIYRRKNYETQSKDYEFSRHSVEEHWAAGLQDVQISLKHPVWLSRHRSKDAVRVFDLTQDGD